MAGVKIYQEGKIANCSYFDQEYVEISKIILIINRSLIYFDVASKRNPLQTATYKKKCMFV